MEKIDCAGSFLLAALPPPPEPAKRPVIRPAAISKPTPSCTLRPTAPPIAHLARIVVHQHTAAAASIPINTLLVSHLQLICHRFVAGHAVDFLHHRDQHTTAPLAAVFSTSFPSSLFLPERQSRLFRSPRRNFAEKGFSMSC